MSTSARLRRWQHEALAEYESRHPEDFLVSATPGAGKTTFALTLAQRLLGSKAVKVRPLAAQTLDGMMQPLRP